MMLQFVSLLVRTLFPLRSTHMDTATKQSLDFNTTTFPNQRTDAQALKAAANEIRRDIIRSLVRAGSGHSGGPLGSADVFAALYFGGVMRYRPEDMHWSGRDRFVLSAGHMAPVMYAALANAGSILACRAIPAVTCTCRVLKHPLVHWGRGFPLP